MNSTKDSYIVHTVDNKWYATSSYTFSPNKEHSVKMTERSADEMIASISSMELVKEAAWWSLSEPYAFSYKVHLDHTQNDIELFVSFFFVSCIAWKNDTVDPYWDRYTKSIH